MVKKKTTKQIPSDAAALMEKFIEEGNYPLLSQSKDKVKKLTASVRERLESSEVKRHVFEPHNMVGKFIAKSIYDIDYLALNEYLFDIGLLLQVAEIDNKAIEGNELYLDMIQDFKLPDTFYIKPNFNKAGKEIIKGLDPFKVPSSRQLDDLVKDIAVLKPQIKILESDYEKLKRKLVNLPEVKKMQSLPKDLRVAIPHKFGSLSLIANQSRYDIPAIYDYIGEWMLIEYAKPNSKLLEKFILNGTLSKKDIDQFRTLVDIRLDFMVMTLEDENKLFNMLDDKNKRAAANRMGA